MSTKYALIDLENIQSPSLQKLKNEGYRLKVFVGATQNKISVELAEQIQTFGPAAEYVRVPHSGKNALDFHIAFYMGQLSIQEPDCQFLVISKDTGYDPLLKHLRESGLKAHRSAASVTPAGNQAKPSSCAPAKPNSSSAKSAPQMSLSERVEFAHKHLQKAGKAKPAKISGLANDLHSKFQKKLNDQAVQDVIKALIKKGIVIENQGSITYQFNASA